MKTVVFLIEVGVGVGCAAFALDALSYGQRIPLAIGAAAAFTVAFLIATDGRPW